MVSHEGTEEVRKRSHFSVAITKEAYDLVTKKAIRFNTGKKAIASEAILNLFRERALLLRMKGGIALGFVAGILIGMVIL